MSMELSRATKLKLRFAIGDRVESKLQDWQPGTVVEQFYVQEGFAAGTCMPYQVALDDGRLIFARQDEGHTIRALLVEPDPEPSILPQRENRGAVARSVIGMLMHIFCAFGLVQLGELFATGHVPFAMSFADSEMPLFVDGSMSIDALGVVALTAAFAVLGLQAKGSSKSEWLERAGIRSRSGKADPPGILLIAVLRAVGQETFYRGALPVLATRAFPENPNNVASGLVLSIVLYSVLHPEAYAFFAAFSGFWFAIAAYHSGVSAAILGSLLAQLAAAALYVGDGSLLADAAPLPEASDEKAKTEAASEPDPETEEAEEPWEPMPWLDPVLPLPESRTLAIRSFRANVVYLSLALVLHTAGDYLAFGQMRFSVWDLGTEPVWSGWLAMCGIGVASGAAVIGGLDTFSAGSSGHMADSATVWLNGRKGSVLNARFRMLDGKPDRLAILLHAVCTAVGQEALFRGALPILIVRLAEAKVLPEFAASYGLTASVIAFYVIHPDELKVFACFAGFCFALAAYGGGLGAAILACAVSQVGAASIYYHAHLRSKRAQKAEEPSKDGKGKAGSKPAPGAGSAKKASKKQR